MTEPTLDYTEDDARLIIKAAFEGTSRIKKYTEQGQSITGETGLGLMSYGANITVDISEHPTDPNKTPITVRGEKKVPINITNDHNKTKAQFIEILNSLRGYPIEDIVDLMSERMGVETDTDSGQKSTTSSRSADQNSPSSGSDSPATGVKADGSGSATVVPDDGVNNSYNSHSGSSTERIISSDRTRRWLKIAVILFVGWIGLNILAAIIDFLVIV
jgi:hypothetical protein